MRNFSFLLLTCLLLLGTVACGQKGPLYLPQPEQQPEKSG